MVKVKRFVIIVKDSCGAEHQDCGEIIEEQINGLTDVEVEIILEIGKVSKA